MHGALAGYRGYKVRGMPEAGRLDRHHFVQIDGEQAIGIKATIGNQKSFRRFREHQFQACPPEPEWPALTGPAVGLVQAANFICTFCVVSDTASGAGDR